jgi:hypothetical protein
MIRSTGMLAATAMILAGGTPALGAETGFYLTAGAGPAAERLGDSNGINISIGTGFFPPVNNIVHLEPVSVESGDDDVGFGLGVGFRFSRYFAAELDYLDFGTAEVTETYETNLGNSFPAFPATLTHEYSSSIAGPAVSALGILPLGKGFEIHLRGGVLFADREIEIPLAVGSGPDTFGDSVWLAGAGVDWTSAGRWGLRAEYQRSGELDSSVVAGQTAVEWLSLRLRFGF